jgi:hypothetical protein
MNYQLIKYWQKFFYADLDSYINWAELVGSIS